MGPQRRQARPSDSSVRRARLCAILLACALSASWPHTTAASDFWDSVRGAARGAGPAAERLRAARVALAAHRADQALAAIGPVLAGEPGEGQLLVVLARAKTMANRHGEALEAYERAARLLDARTLIAEVDALPMARFALQAGRYELALRALSGHADATARPLTRAALRVAEGHALQAIGPERVEQAIAAYRDALRAVPEHAAALLGLALALHRQGSRDAALAIAKRVRDPAQLDQSLLENALPPSEQRARAALWRESIADLSAARATWHEAMQAPGPWREHARATLVALDARVRP